MISICEAEVFSPTREVWNEEQLPHNVHMLGEALYKDIWKQIFTPLT